LVADARIGAVMFTGSTAVARLIQGQLAGRLTAAGQSIPLIAETGGQNALIVDSSALPEQVVADVLTSAFDSAGQRCSALRVLCLQEDVAERVLTMLKGAMQELCVGNPDRLAVDVGPVITEEARQNIEAHVQSMRRAGHAVEQLALPASAAHGTFVPPTLIEIDDVGELKREVFGPVLHLLRFRRAHMDRLVDAINDTGYGLTFGLHTRIDETIASVTERIEAGNIYINRNLIGAVVGVQPFGGHGLSGTGPKAGGPLYLQRLVTRKESHGASAKSAVGAEALAHAPVTDAFKTFLSARGFPQLAARIAHYQLRSSVGTLKELPGPVGERNVYVLKPRGRIAALASNAQDTLLQLGDPRDGQSRGDRAVNPAVSSFPGCRRNRRAHRHRSAASAHRGRAVCRHSGRVWQRARAARIEGPIIIVQGATPEALADGSLIISSSCCCPK
jgi:RHH-type proline utilization regulon transcriptional repressor/proline dehydrogenase/delta 1-pyrroline-5-carboxylate dehydrogenase